MKVIGENTNSLQGNHVHQAAMKITELLAMGKGTIRHYAASAKIKKNHVDCERNIL